MNISAAAERSGVSAKMIRYYESIGLIRTAGRRDNNYRDYGDAEVAMLQFVRRTRDLGFSLEEVSALLTLWQDRKRSSREVRKLAAQHLADLETKMAEMRAVSRTLKRLVDTCHGDDRPDCPILDDLATSSARAKSTKRKTQ
ncbi:MAG: Cu(I)-responsive transcriptional regulator [Hyphomonadaceae bacterium]